MGSRSSSSFILMIFLAIIVTFNRKAILWQSACDWCSDSQSSELDALQPTGFAFGSPTILPMSHNKKSIQQMPITWASRPSRPPARGRLESPGPLKRSLVRGSQALHLPRPAEALEVNRYPPGAETMFTYVTHMYVYYLLETYQIVTDNQKSIELCQRCFFRMYSEAYGTQGHGLWQTLLDHCEDHVLKTIRQGRSIQRNINRFLEKLVLQNAFLARHCGKNHAKTVSYG